MIARVHKKRNLTIFKLAVHITANEGAAGKIQTRIKIVYEIDQTPSIRRRQFESVQKIVIWLFLDFDCFLLLYVVPVFI